MFWAGSDDGLVHVSRDGGESWDDVTPSDLPEWSYIRTLEPSPFDAATVYLAATRYKLDDNKPYLYKSTDYGQTWHSIVGEGDSSVPDDEFVRVIRTDPERPGLLYVGTETGLYVSMDDGVSWDRWESNLPVSPIYDLTVKGTDLVIATHGRSFWIMDDLTPLRQLDDAADAAEMLLFKPRETWRILPDLFHAWTGSDGKDYAIGLGKPATFNAGKNETGHLERTILDAGQSAPLGMTATYFMAEPLESGASLSLSFLNDDGEVVRSFHPKPPGHDKLEDDEKAFAPGPWITARTGVNRFFWDLRYEGSTRVMGNKLAAEANLGPLVVPGTYQVQLTVTDAAGAEHTHTETFEVVNDPRADAAQSDLDAQLELLLQIRDKISAAHRGVITIRSMNEQLAHWQERLTSDEQAHTDITGAARSLADTLSAVENELIVPGQHEDTFGLNEPSRLNAKLSSLISIVGSADAKPTKQASDLVESYSKEIDAQLEKLHTAMDTELSAFNALLKEADLPAVQ